MFKIEDFRRGDAVCMILFNGDRVIGIVSGHNVFESHIHVRIPGKGIKPIRIDAIITLGYHN